MKRYFTVSDVPSFAAGSAVTLGVFDGVHRGHMAVLAETVRQARADGLVSLVVTFDAHPRGVLGDSPPPAITSLEHRLVLFDQAGFDAALVLPFSEELASMAPEEFAECILAQALSARAVVLGHDSRFGCGGKGSSRTIERLAPRLGWRVTCVPPVVFDGVPVSSTAIRQAVGAGALDRAEAMLGRPVSVLGTVVHGGHVGRDLGFPTLNIDPHHELHPPRGVYVTTTRGGESHWPSVTNIGHRPTIDAQTADDLIIETHVLATVGTLYDQQAEVLFRRKIRDEMKFATTQALAEQIRRDIAAARADHAANPSGGA